MRNLKTLILLLVFLMSACAPSGARTEPAATPTDRSQAGGGDLTNTQWELASFGEEGTETQVVDGSKIRLFARSGIMYEGKVYNDLVPDKGTLTVTLPSSAVTTTPSTVISATGSVVSAPSTAGADMSPTLLLAVLGIAAVGITILVIRKRRSSTKSKS